MPYKIALISTEDHCNYLRTMDLSSLDCSLSFLTYESWRQLPSLYQKVKDDFDGFCTTGLLPQKVLLRIQTGRKKPVQGIMVRSVEYYKEFFKLLAQNRALDLSRVYLDFSLIDGWELQTMQGYVTKNFVVEKYQEKLPSVDCMEDYFQLYERQIVDRALQLWRDGALDVLVTRYSSAVAGLKRNGIPYVFVYPDRDNVMDTLHLLISQIRVVQMERALPAVIVVSTPELRQKNTGEISLVDTDLQRALLEFDERNHSDFLIQKAGSGFELFTTREAVRRMTKDFTDCLLMRDLRERYGIEVQIGYGIGREMNEARSHSYRAFQNASRWNASCLINEDHELIGPLGREILPPAEDPSGRELQIAKQAGLSLETIQRLSAVIQALHTREFTVRELAQIFQVTTVNANRILNALERGGAAEVVSMRKKVAKGRPSRVYHINL